MSIDGNLARATVKRLEPNQVTNTIKQLQAMHDEWLRVALALAAAEAAEAPDVVELQLGLASVEGVRADLVAQLYATCVPAAPAMTNH